MRSWHISPLAAMPGGFYADSTPPATSFHNGCRAIDGARCSRSDRREIQSNLIVVRIRALAGQARARRPEPMRSQQVFDVFDHVQLVIVRRRFIGVFPAVERVADSVAGAQAVVAGTAKETIAARAAREPVVVVAAA